MVGCAEGGGREEVGDGGLCCRQGVRQGRG